MMRIIPGFPDDIVAIEIHGRISRNDYQTILVETVNDRLKRYKSVKILYLIGLIDAFDLSVIWEDTAFNLKPWREISCLALVTDYDWIKSIVTLFVPLFSGELRMFKIRDLETAREWLASRQGPDRRKVA